MCMWCKNLRMCTDRNAYLASFPYGQCMDWTTQISDCPDPRRRPNGKPASRRSCIEDMYVGSFNWCYFFTVIKIPQNDKKASTSQCIFLHKKKKMIAFVLSMCCRHRYWRHVLRLSDLCWVPRRSCLRLVRRRKWEGSGYLPSGRGLRTLGKEKDISFSNRRTRSVDCRRHMLCNASKKLALYIMSR